MAQHLASSSTVQGGSANLAPSRPRAGRPRSSTVDRQILETAIRILQADGYPSLNIERVAEESGIAKTTIYRRYKDRQDLAAAAIAALLEAHGAFRAPDTGSCRADLEIASAAMVSVGTSSPVLSVLGAVLSERHREADLVERMWARAFGPHHATLAAILQRGIDRGEVRAGLVIQTTVEILVGAVIARLISGSPAGGEWIESVIGTLWLGIRSGRS